MEGIALREKALEAFKKYRLVLLVLLAGMFLMLLPESNTEIATSEEAAAQEQPQTLQDSLGDILSMIEGAGKVRVLLTQASGERIQYQTDEDISTGDSTSDIRRETVIVTDGSRVQTGLVQRVDPPVYQGAVILCQGADSAAVRLAIVEAVANATGLSSDKISVLKMK